MNSEKEHTRMLHQLQSLISYFLSMFLLGKKSPTLPVRRETIVYRCTHSLTFVIYIGLYGPLYMPPESSSDLITHPSLSFLSPNQQKNTATSDICYTIDSKNKNPTPKKLPLKPVLKKNIPSTSNVMLQREYWIRNDRYWSKCASDSGKQSVRFNPNITEVNFLPETPVKESFSNSKKRNEHSSYFSLDSEGEEEDEDDEELWDVIVQVGSYFKSVLFTSLFKSKTTHKPNANTLATPNQQVIKSSNSNLFNFDLIQFCVSSAVSFTAWIMYQTFSTVIKHTPFAPASTTNHIKTQRRAVTKPASQQLLHRKNKGTLVV